MTRIAFDNAARDAVRISAVDREVITDCAIAANVPVVFVTSTARTPEEQASAMYSNLVAYGVAQQKALYGQYGDLIIDVFADSHAKGITSESQIVQAMTRMIIQIGPGRVSTHCASPEEWEKRHTIDISYSRMPAENRAAFDAAIVADKRIGQHFDPLTKNHIDPCFHLVITQPATT